ncbi:MAG: hypothetical protein A3I89_02090 [Candidatus Harrisonbacteria bacterium RIFCSPLOWO2_02_FULL_41_11]|uniref:Gfo/Idh/MocA-like oxidoreductase N-terminal domain-containing protein n=1 Tax=Candidatus Harrisonbacteria bacterium RIFCSPHIGHO2_02_FULL_42_16 TaxID=1798404 RepID=A0A1G1ZGA5_9BACT|nr:MAG: hypothetical protein A3B92_01680 [Candidatus Harrisonbacteria bacterium RIFCSPHIGHO2_02_FULL_42_16]OGY65649.1 MAG: hypothetical protein A3I89_02090 [Candidatus Harrisonbacteria bacterium RIFCSPLOWO2_02_FULL_41_11]
MNKNSHLRFFIVGLGSMGKRRIRNLYANSEKDIVGFDIRPDRNKEAQEKYGIKVVENFKDVLPENFDVLIISTPPEAHGDYIRFAIKHKKHFFVEHPVFDDGYQDIFAEKRRKDSMIVMAPSCTMLFYQPVKMIKKILDDGKIGKILAFQYHMGQYLPDWHPWEDYRDVYFSKKETSACREMLPFELIWLNSVMDSRVAEIAGTITKVSNLDMDADDIALANVKYENGIFGNIIIDVISRKPFRTLRVLGSDGILDWEKFSHSIVVYDAKTKQSETTTIPQGHLEPGYVNPEEQYIEEIKAFLDTIAGKGKYPHSFEENLHNLKTLYALEKAYKSKTYQSV